MNYHVPETVVSQFIHSRRERIDQISLFDLEINLALNRSDHSSGLQLYFSWFSRFLGCKIRKMKEHQWRAGRGNETLDWVCGDKETKGKQTCSLSCPHVSVGAAVLIGILFRDIFGTFLCILLTQVHYLLKHAEWLYFGIKIEPVIIM